MQDSIICPRCGERVTVGDRYFFTVVRDATHRPVEMRVMEEGKVRHGCVMSREVPSP